jgi:ABC-2 type transport system permease protein
MDRVSIAPRPLGPVNSRGVWTLFYKETRRYLDSWWESVLAPVLSSLLFLAVFALALGGIRAPASGVPYLDFLAPGLIMVAIFQSAFGTMTETMMMSKYMGCTDDFLMPPLRAGELALGFGLAGAVRGLMVAGLTWAACALAIGLAADSLWRVLLFGTSAALTLSFAGLVVGIWGDRWEHTEAVTHFVIGPLALLSGSFFSLDRLAEGWHWLMEWNPAFYLIDGLRAGFLGSAEGHAGIGLTLALLLPLLSGFGAWRMLARGYKLKH